MSAATAIVLYTGSINRAVIDEAVNSGARALVLKKIAQPEKRLSTAADDAFAAPR